jgi:hypothetical protein
MVHTRGGGIVFFYCAETYAELTRTSSILSNASWVVTGSNLVEARHFICYVFFTFHGLGPLTCCDSELISETFSDTFVGPFDGGSAHRKVSP